MFRRRPCCHSMMAPMMAPMPAPACHMPLPAGPVLPFGGGCEQLHNPHTQVVVEPTMVAAPNVFHHHQNVEHIVPVLTQDIHHFHNHHSYAVKHEHKPDEVLTHNHGLCGPPSLPAAMPCPPC